MYYIYAYLRKDGSPYYIGKGKNYRAWSKDHSVNLPKDKSKIIIMESNLTEVGAFALERFYIRWYGRKDINTGILRNLTDGGEGGKLSEITRQKLSISNKGQIPWSKGKNLSIEHKQKIGKSNKGKSRSVGVNNPRYGKGHLITGINNPNAKKWELFDGKTTTIIYDLVKFCEINNLKYNTVYSWQNQYVDNKQKLRKI
jgi:hypothetical protein